MKQIICRLVFGVLIGAELLSGALVAAQPTVNIVLVEPDVRQQPNIAVGALTEIKLAAQATPPGVTYQWSSTAGRFDGETTGPACIYLLPSQIVGASMPVAVTVTVTDESGATAAVSLSFTLTAAVPPTPVPTIAPTPTLLPTGAPTPEIPNTPVPTMPPTSAWTIAQCHRNGRNLEEIKRMLEQDVQKYEQLKRQIALNADMIEAIKFVLCDLVELETVLHANSADRQNEELVQRIQQTQAIRVRYQNELNLRSSLNQFAK